MTTTAWQRVQDLVDRKRKLAESNPESRVATAGNKPLVSDSDRRRKLSHDEIQQLLETWPKRAS